MIKVYCHNCKKYLSQYEYYTLHNTTHLYCNYCNWICQWTVEADKMKTWVQELCDKRMKYEEDYLKVESEHIYNSTKYGANELGKKLISEIELLHPIDDPDHIKSIVGDILIKLGVSL